MFCLTQGMKSIAVLGGLFIGTCQAASLTVLVGGGMLGDSMMTSVVEPFEKATGIKVNAVKQQCAPAIIRTMAQSKRQDIDLCMLSSASMIVLAREGLLGEINYQAIDPAVAEQIEPALRHKYGVGFFNYAIALGYDRSKLRGAVNPPQSWGEFWDPKKFPGSRILQSGAYPGQGPWEEALIADGVPVEKLYPIDVDRALKSLDKIKPAVRKWWMVGAEQEQAFSGGGAAMGQGFDGVFQNVMKTNEKVAYTYAQAKIYTLHLVVPKGAKNSLEAEKFINFALNAERQALFSKLSGYSPTNRSAFKFLDPAFASTLVGAPGNKEKAYYSNADWYSALDASGKTNAEALINRWNEWVLK